MSGKYEELRLQNLKDNQRILAEIGLVNPFKKLPKVTFKKAKRSVKRRAPEELQQQPRKLFIAEGLDDCGSIRGSRRRSARIQGKDAATDDEIKQEVQEWEEDEDRPKPVPKDRPNFYGAVPGVEVGTTWLTRMECCRDGVHRPTVAGIHGGPEGTYSIALSGGYDDNVDLGEGFTYTGEGGRDLKGTKNNPKNLRTAPQSKDQTLTRGNLALSKNVETKQPVRVIRGYKLNSPFAPEDGYRYDGMYSVEKAWFTTGLSGFGVWKFALRRCADQAPPPWSFIEDNTDKISETGKSDSGFDSDETGSHLGSQDSDDGSEKQEMKESDEESGLNEDEKEESATVDDKKDEDAEQQEDVSDACN